MSRIHVRTTAYALRRKVFRVAFWESMFVANVNSSSVQICKHTDDKKQDCLTVDLISKPSDMV